MTLKPPPAWTVGTPASTARASTSSTEASSTGPVDQQVDVLAQQVLDVGHLLGRIEGRVGDDQVLDLRMEGFPAHVLQSEHDPGIGQIAGRDSDLQRAFTFLNEAVSTISAALAVRASSAAWSARDRGGRECGR